MNHLELEQIRKRIGWTKRELAKRLGLKERTVHRYIDGETPISPLVSKMIMAYDEGYRPKEEE